MTPDLNVLIAASRSDHPQHKQALTWLNGAIEASRQGQNLQILPMIAAGFLRLVTHPRVFVNPTPLEHAAAFLDGLLRHPGVEMPELGQEWPLFLRLCREHILGGNDIPDAWIAAAVLRTGNHLVTFDRGFTRLLTKKEVTLLS